MKRSVSTLYCTSCAPSCPHAPRAWSHLTEGEMNALMPLKSMTLGLASVFSLRTRVAKWCFRTPMR
eukprot:12902251-Prorocentrum_lima.AAC.1